MERSLMNVPETLVDLLAAARAEGRCFEDAWPAATLAAVAGASSWEREQWLGAFTATREAWQAGFEREHAPRTQRAVLALLDPDEREAENAMESDRVAA